MSKSPDMRGTMVRMMAADHPFAGRVGLVVDQDACHVCGGCDYDDLIVEVDGQTTRVYEPEAEAP